MAAHPVVTMGQDISTTASSSALARGQIGDMDMGGANIASTAMETDDMSPDIETMASMGRIVDTAAQSARATMTKLTAESPRLTLMRRHRITALLPHMARQSTETSLTAVATITRLYLLRP
jgi:hypothetical protein